MKRLAKPLPLLALLFSGGALFAHHGNSAYDETARVPIRGTVTEFIWVNPHSQIYLDVKDSSGKVVNWGVETNSPGILGRAGWTRRSLKAGDPMAYSRPWMALARDFKLRPRAEIRQGYCVASEEQAFTKRIREPGALNTGAAPKK